MGFGGPEGIKLEPVPPLDLLSELEDWAEILHHSPELIHKLREFEAVEAVEAERQERELKGPDRRLSPGPKRNGPSL